MVDKYPFIYQFLFWGTLRTLPPFQAKSVLFAAVWYRHLIPEERNSREKNGLTHIKGGSFQVDLLE